MKTVTYQEPRCERSYDFITGELDVHEEPHFEVTKEMYLRLTKRIQELEHAVKELNNG
jgi:hypothetical protein